MRNIVVRALTFFTRNVLSKDDLNEEFQYAGEVLNYVENELKKMNMEVFTKRISFTGLSRELTHELINHAPKDILISIGYSKNLTLEDIVQLAENGLYVPLIYNQDPNLDKARFFSRVIHKASEKDPAASTRISIGFHDESFQTPYFPDSSSRGHRSIGLSFIYPKHLIYYIQLGYTIENAFVKVFEEFQRVAILVNELTKLPVYIDYSLSPWMENSIVELYNMLGFRILEPGSLYFTWILNKYIDLYSNKLSRTGFNEVMLPYAEDALLLEYGAAGLIKARDFLFYASTCVAGVDMIVVPEDESKLALMIASEMALSRVKSKPMSFRAIPVQSKPGDLVELGKFGKVPVIPY
ncbi:MAG: DUF711 family protein [Desulfurococcaceae archaeon]